MYFQELMIMKSFVANIHLVQSYMRRASLLVVLTFSVAISGWAHADTLSVRVGNGSDDAEEHINEGNSMDVGRSDLELGAEGGAEDAQLIGLRFTGIDIPRSATINSASIQFTVDETDDEEQMMPIQIYGELGDALAFNASAGNISGRTRTGLFVDWNDIPPWDSQGVADVDQQTPDISSVLQAIVNQGAWAPDNALVIIMTGVEQFERTAESFEGDAGAAALLTIDFDPNNLFLTGDFNSDGVVDMADFQILSENFNTGTNFAEGDATFDGVVDLDDFIQFREAFAVASGAAVAAVPEPTTLPSMAILAILGLVASLRKSATWCQSDL